MVKSDPEKSFTENSISTRASLIPSMNTLPSASPVPATESLFNSDSKDTSFHKKYISVSQESSDIESDVSTNSFLDDLIENLGVPLPTVDHPDALSKEECAEIRDKMRKLKLEEFLDYFLKFEDFGDFEEREHVYLLITVLTAFSLREILKRLVFRELRKRERITQYKTPDDVVSLLERSKNIVVLVGAGLSQLLKFVLGSGISTSLGIPDFRSSDGIYADVGGSNEIRDPQEIFDYLTFKLDPTLFYRYAHKVYPRTKSISPTHAFLNLLHEQHKLLRVYSQNIDNLEFESGLPREKIVQCHGSFATASCMQCGQQISGKEIETEILNGVVAYCKNPECIEESTIAMNRQITGATKRKRKKQGSDDENELSQGVMKPDITFFHENLPSAFFSTLQKDQKTADFLIAIGTSLKVSPVAEMIGFFSVIPQVYISKTPVTHLNFDVCLLGPCDEIVCDLARKLNWKINHDWILEKKSLQENMKYIKDDILQHQWHLNE